MDILYNGSCQAPLSMEFSRQEYWSGLPCPPPADLPNPGIKPEFPALQTDSLPLNPCGSMRGLYMCMWASQVVLVIKTHTLEKEVPTHSGILAWEIHRQRRYSPQRPTEIRHDLATKQQNTHTDNVIPLSHNRMKFCRLQQHGWTRKVFC